MKKQVLVATAVGVALIGGQAVHAQSRVIGSRPYAEGRLLVKFKSGVGESAKHSILLKHGAARSASIPAIGVDVISVARNTDIDSRAVELSREGAFEFVTPDYKATLAQATYTVPNDPYAVNSQYGVFQINCHYAWTITQGSPNVTIAVIDSGVQGNHPDLTSQMVPGWNTASNNSDTSDSLGHGTVVASVCAASTNNGVGVSGVAWNCKFMPLKVADSSNTIYQSAVDSALTWAADHGAKVANMSMSYTPDSAFESAASYFRSKGGIVISAAGNYGTNTNMSADPNVLTVSAVNTSNVIYSWSSFGSNVDLCAPGSDYTASIGTSQYISSAGTSVSSPFVAGVAALVYSVNPNLSPSQVENVMESTATDLGTVGWDPYYGYGMVNALAAVQQAQTLVAADTVPPTVSFSQPSNGQTVSGTLTVAASASDNVGVSSVTVSIDGQKAYQGIAPPFSFNWDTTAAANGNHTLSVTAVDTSNNSATSTVTVNVSNSTGGGAPPADTTPPSITLTSPNSGSTIPKTGLKATVNASDNVGVVKVELYLDGRLATTSTASPWSCSVGTKTLLSGNHSVYCKAYDAAGNVGQSQTITVVK